MIEIHQGEENMHRRFFPALIGVIGAVLALSVAGRAAPAGNGLTIPAFQHWYLVNSMIVTKDSPMFAAIGGLHHIYVNSVGFARLQKGGSTPYPDGTVFADDVREVSLGDGLYSQGGRKAITVMVKDAKKFPTTGGWGFEAWAGGDPKKPLATDPVKMCFACHTPQKANDFVFSTFLH
jgi:Cytochrome P460